MIALIVVLIVIAILVIAVIVLYNNLVQLRNRVDNAWSQIDVQLQRRLDLIPNLVETVKGYASHERGTFEAVTQARNAVMAAPTPEAKMEADNVLTGTLKRTPTSSNSKLNSPTPKTRSATCVRATTIRCSITTTPSRPSRAISLRACSTSRSATASMRMQQPQALPWCHSDKAMPKEPPR